MSHTDLTRLFEESTEAAPEGFSESVLIAVQNAAERQARDWRRFWGVFSVLSLGTFVASGFYAAHSAAASGFSSYFSLLFSDGSAIAGIWREVGLSLLESLPVLAGAAVFASICAVLWSLRKFSKYAGISLLASFSARTA